MFFNILADAADDSAELGAQAIDVVRRTNNGILDSVGIGGLLPTPVRNLAENAYNVPQNLILGAGHSSATLLRNIDRFVDGEPVQEYQEEEKEEENEKDEYQHSGGENNENHHGGKDYNNRGYDRDEEDSDDDSDNTEEDSDAGPGGASYNKSGHGARPDLPDHRDHPYQPTMAPTGPFVDLRQSLDLPPVYDQGNMMSCTAHAVAGAFEIETLKIAGQPLFSPSRLFLWYNARAAIANSKENPDAQAIKKNIGTYIRDAIKSLNKKGVCSEEDWSYETGKYNKKTFVFSNGAKPAMQPTKLAREHAHQHLVLETEYKRLQVTGNKILPQLKECLHDGHPVIFGMRTHGLLNSSSIDSSGRGLAATVPIKLPKAAEVRHSLLAVGYIENESERVVIVRNSWGSSFGEEGYFYMPYPYLKLCYDFWILKPTY